MLEIRDISTRLGGAYRLTGASFRQPPGQFLAVIGPNGAGKSTLLKTISGEVSPDRGDIRIGQRARHEWPRRELARYMAVMGQAPSLAFDFTVRELVELGRAPHRGTNASRNDKAIVEAAIELAGLSELTERSVPTLSGGERQRTFFAKSVAQLMASPDTLPGEGQLLLLDEPTSALDLAQQARVMNAARRIARSGGAILAILHDLNLAAAFADRVIVMVRGEIVADGSPAQVLIESQLSHWYDCQVNVNAVGKTETPLISICPEP